jgi:hypothetical protein
MSATPVPLQSSAYGSIGTPTCRAAVTTCTLLKDNTKPPNSLWTPMSNVKPSALTILGAFEEAHSEITGKAVVLTDGKAGTVETIWLDELHGLLVSIRGHDGKWPVSTVKLEQKRPITDHQGSPAEPCPMERITDSSRTSSLVRFMPTLLQKSFCEVGLKFSDPQARRSNNDVGDHVAKRLTHRRFW